MSYGPCGAVHITANEARVWLRQDHLHITSSRSPPLSLFNAHSKHTGLYVNFSLSVLSHRKLEREGEDYFVEESFSIYGFLFNFTDFPS